ncbi:MAG: N-succinylglutamate 5-semialdehyde dehydrogenase [Myxococcales bacterium]|nr:N-succinylglutamate 5-semialdehyde dehydrogenase [Myxococcales bacterium]
MTPMAAYIEGRWYPEGSKTLTVISPAEGEALESFPFSPAHSAQAIEAARKAFPAWAALGLEGRTPYLRRLQEALARRKESIAKRISLEVGKPLWESRGEAGGLAPRVDLVLGPIAEDISDIVLPNDGGRACHLPLGVVAVLGPFNFPAHLANGQILPALAAGNTVILKPSEKAPGVAQLYGEAFAEADLPPGVFNLVQGDAETGGVLVASPEVDGLLFTGSTRVGLAILAATHQQPHKLVALEMGGKNAALVAADAQLGQTAEELLMAAYVTCGQRCTASSQAFVHRDVIDELSDRLAALVPRLSVGHPLEEEAFMGPIIDQHARQRLLNLNQAAQTAGVDTLVAGQAIDRPGAYLTPALRRGPWQDTTYFQSEHFGPDLVLIPYQDEDDAVRTMTQSGYGLAASIFTADRQRFERLAPRLRAGIVNFNRSTVGASGQLPFGGWAQSGNHRPGARYAGRLVSAAQARLHGPAPLPNQLLNCLGAQS